MNEYEEAKEVAIKSWGCLWGIALIVFSMALSGFVTMKLWNGLIVPTFGFATLNYWQAFGLDLFVSFLTAKIGNKNDGYENNQNDSRSVVLSDDLVVRIFARRAFS